MTWDLSEEERGERGEEAAGTGEVVQEVVAEEREGKGGGVAAEVGVVTDEEREEAGAEIEMTEKRDRMKIREILRNKRRERRKACPQLRKAI